MLSNKIQAVLPLLNEYQKRLYLASEAEYIGHGGVKQVAAASQISRKTIIKGKTELALIKWEEQSANYSSKENVKERIRKKGGGRKSIETIDPKLLQELDKLLEPLTRGHPESVLKWTCLSTRTLAEALTKRGYKISHTKVGALLKSMDFSLQSNSKQFEGSSHPDRNEQFMYISKQTGKYLQNNLPAISVDTKKKELIGNFKNSGQAYHVKKQPRKVNVHDFGDKKAAPYGIYDIGNNKGFINVGTSSDTSEFAVFSIKQWWLKMGKKQFPEAHKLLITADGGGSNSHRTKLWKTELQNLANQLQMEITVCHFPPGTSKWNKIEHRLFSHISINWKGIPLEDYETVVQLIGAVKTTTGLKVKARLDLNEYEKGVSVSKDKMEQLNIKRHKFHPDWNYTIKPNK
jgi:transposase